MALWKPDPTFYPSPRLAGQAPGEKLAYVVTLNPNHAADGKPDALVVLDTDPASPTYTQIVGRAEATHPGDEFHHFGWNACSAALCPYAPHPHIERRYLLIPALKSSRIYVFDTKPDPRSPSLSKRLKPPRSPTRPATAARIHCIAARTAFMSVLWAMSMATAPAGFLF